MFKQISYSLRLTAYAIIGIAVIVGAGIAFDLGGLSYQKWTAPFRGKSEAERQLESGASRIQRYNEFFALCSGIRAKESAIDAVRMNTAMEPGKRGAAIAANQAARGRLIADYNTKSASAYTEARFKDAKLPYRIDSSAYDKTKTLCEGQ